MKAFALLILLTMADDTTTVALQPAHTDGLNFVQTAEACDAIAQAQELRMLLSLSSGNGIYKDVRVFCVSRKRALTFVHGLRK